jgi:hypothetical protein
MSTGPGTMNATLSSLMGGGGGGNQTAEFGYTETGTAGRWMDVTLYTSRRAGDDRCLGKQPAEEQKKKKEVQSLRGNQGRRALSDRPGGQTTLHAGEGAPAGSEHPLIPND